MRGWVLRRVAALCLVLVASACALTEDKETLAYVADGSVVPLPGAATVLVSVSASDARTQFRDRISTKKNGYGMEMARIVAANDVLELVRGSVERELKAEGFMIGPGGLALAVELQSFYSNFRYSWTWTAAAEVAFTVRVQTAAGALLYTGTYDGTANIEGLLLASGSNAKEALQKALAQALRKMLDDRALQAALLSGAAAARGAGS